MPVVGDISPHVDSPCTVPAREGTARWPAVSVPITGTRERHLVHSGSRASSCWRSSSSPGSSASCDRRSPVLSPVPVALIGNGWTAGTSAGNLINYGDP